MFFSDEDHTIIDYQTLRRVLEKCDGDVAYLLKIFRELPSWSDHGRKNATQEVLVGNRTVTYEVCGINHLIDFSPNQYKSVGVDKKMLDDFLEAGGHPFDVLSEITPDSSDSSED